MPPETDDRRRSGVDQGGLGSYLVIEKCGTSDFWTDGRLAWGQGTLREKRPGVFEIRVAVGVDPVSGRTVQRSFWFHGALEDAEERRRELAAQFAEYRSIRRAAPFLTVGELLERWLAAQHDWRPSTWVGVRSNVKALSADPIAGRRVATLRPEVVRVTMARWREAGAGVSVVSGRFRVLRSAVGWAQSESIIDRNPFRDMRGPPRPGTRMHVPEQDVLALLRMSEVLVEKAGGIRRFGRLAEITPQGRTGPTADAAGGRLGGSPG